MFWWNYSHYQIRTLARAIYPVSKRSIPHLKKAPTLISPPYFQGDYQTYFWFRNWLRNLLVVAPWFKSACKFCHLLNNFSHLLTRWWWHCSRGVRHFRNFVQFSKKPGETSRILTESPRISRIPWNPLESPGVPLNPQESPGILWKPQESLGNPKNPHFLFT